jgi:hypothetical protein
VGEGRRRAGRAKEGGQQVKGGEGTARDNEEVREEGGEEVRGGGHTSER